MKKYNSLTDFIKDNREIIMNISFKKDYILFYIKNNIPIKVNKIRIFNSSFYKDTYEIKVAAFLDVDLCKFNLDLEDIKTIAAFIEAIEYNKDIFYNLIDNI